MCVCVLLNWCAHINSNELLFALLCVCVCVCKLRHRAFSFKNRKQSIVVTRAHPQFLFRLLLLLIRMVDLSVCDANVNMMILQFKSCVSETNWSPLAYLIARNISILILFTVFATCVYEFRRLNYSAILQVIERIVQSVCAWKKEEKKMNTKKNKRLLYCQTQWATSNCQVRVWWNGF